jgi:hypothetical protein
MDSVTVFTGWREGDVLWSEQVDRQLVWCSRCFWFLRGDIAMGGRGAVFQITLTSLIKCRGLYRAK